MGKRKWARPMLLVLTRGKAEEKVLGSCKTDMMESSVGANTFDDHCAVVDDCDIACNF